MRRFEVYELVGKRLTWVAHDLSQVLGDDFDFTSLA